MKDYLLYVRKYCIFTNDYELYVYHCKTSDILHTIGEMHYRTLEHIKRIDFVEDRPALREYWKSKDKTIYEWYDKYVGSVL